MAGKNPVCLSETLRNTLARLRQLNTQDIQSQWHQTLADIELSSVGLSSIFDSSIDKHWSTAPLNERHHIAWGKGLKVLWLYQKLTVPTHFYGYPLAGLTPRLALTWWAEDAQIYVDGILVQSGDLFECFTRICLGEWVKPGDSFEVAIRLVSPGHDDGALVRSHLTYETPANQPTPEPSFIADELTVLATLEPQSQQKIEAALTHLAWDSLNKTTDPKDSLNLWQDFSPSTSIIPATIHPFQQSLSQLRRTLKPFTTEIKQHKIHCVGHAHLDMAWLWPIADTWDAAERTFRSILTLQQDFPELTYTHSSPALFEWLEHNRPELFARIQEKVKEGSWSIDAGLWIEPEFNIVSGEAIARHILYGQRYCQEKFGSISKIAWLPDSFGFCWQLPQLLIQGGIEIFATLKLSWNDTTDFPHQLFWWESPDGSRILSLMLPAIGTDIDPVKMADHAAHWENSTAILDTLWLPGMGDHGGGPTRDMLEKARRWEKSPFFPTLNFTNPERYIEELPTESTELPIWKNDLYLELHRGCYTTHADQKQQNRRSEDLLYQAEAFATIAHLTADQPYPKAQIETAWKKLLFNQFHDILPGTSIPEVFVDANRDWAAVREIGHQVLEESICAIASQITRPEPPHPEAQTIFAFNSLSWKRSAIITLDLPTSSNTHQPSHRQIYDTKNNLIKSQIASSKHSEKNCKSISFLASSLPAVGYQTFWLCPNEAPEEQTPQSQPSQPQAPPEKYILENEFLIATIASNTGHILSLINKSTQQETFSTPGNQLQAFKDKGQYWDAWNIAPNYEKHLLPEPDLQSLQWIEYGSIRQRLRVTYKLGQSTIHQTYRLDAKTPYICVDNHIDWQETQVLLKANFPLTVTSDHATYEIPFGAITRTTQPKTEAEKAQWESPALRWADLSQSDNSSGTSILTDSKHGFDASPNHLRLTLLKSPIWPNPQADKGIHHFTYAIYPHASSWQTARTAHHAKALNIPAIIHSQSTSQANISKLPPTHSFLEIHNSNIILSALKPSEDDSSQFIFRCYNTTEESSNLQTTNTLALSEPTAADSSRINLLEQPMPEDPYQIKPWQIA
ncbi:MAG: alpha-mannosidase, partial [Cyanobacteria bacterium J06607_10]